MLDVGAGSGYQAAVLAELVPRGQVFAVERIGELATPGSQQQLQALHYRVDRELAGRQLRLARACPLRRHRRSRRRCTEHSGAASRPATRRRPAGRSQSARRIYSV